MNRRSRGFTLVEMVVIMPVMIVAIAITITFILNVFLSISSKNTSITLEIAAQSALFTIRDDILFANFFEGTIQPNETDASKAGSWNAQNDNALIVSEIAYTANRQNPNRAIVYVKDAPNACASSDVTENQPSTNTLIYFLYKPAGQSTGKLYRRTVIPDQTKNCSTTFRKQSCDAAHTGPSCPLDTLLSDDVKTFSITYYSSKTSDGGDADVVLDSDILSDTRKYIRITKADITLTLERLANGEPVTTTAKLSLKKAE